MLGSGQRKVYNLSMSREAVMITETRLLKKATKRQMTLNGLGEQQ